MEFVNLSSEISKLRKLKTLGLEFSDVAKLYNNDFSHIYKWIEALTDLEHYKLSLKQTVSLMNIEMCKMIKDSIITKPNLKVLDLTF